MSTELLLFTTKTCGPCKMFKPIVEETIRMFDDIDLVIVDAQENPEMAQGYGIQSVPFIIVKRGHATHKHNGAMGRSDLITLLEAIQNDN